LNNPAKPILTVYYRKGCHLCDHMTACLRALQTDINFDFELIDIDQDTQLRQRYDVDVPVVALQGEVLCYHFFDEDMVRQALLYG